MATAGLCVTVGAGGIPTPALIAILVAVVLIIMAFVFWRVKLPALGCP